MRTSTPNKCLGKKVQTCSISKLNNTILGYQMEVGTDSGINKPRQQDKKVNIDSKKNLTKKKKL